MYETTYDGGGLAATMWLVILGLYLYFALALYKIAQKTGHSDKAWWAFVPILNTYLLVKTAGRPGYWFWFCLIPIINLIVLVVLWIDVARACHQSPIWGFLTIVPFINLLSIAVLAFSSSQQPRQFTADKPAPRQPQQVG